MTEKELIILLILSIISTNGQERRPAIKLQGNGYVNLIVALKDKGESSQEVDQLVSGLSVLLEEGSHQLYVSTRKTFYLRNVTILLPTSWQSSVRELSSLSAAQAHIGIGFEEYDEHYVAYVERDPTCGVRAGHKGNMQISKKFLKDSLKTEKRRTLFGKTLVHEFGHYLFGIYDEYGGVDHNDYVKDGKTLHMQCTANMKVKGQRNCQPTIWNSFCKVIEQPNGSHYASLMDTQYLEGVTEFCDNDTSNPNTLHNRDAPSKQNLLCQHRSAWEVIRAHQDYKDVLNLTEETRYQPLFLNIVRSNIERTVLVFDISGSMTECKISLLYQLVRQHFQYRLDNAMFVGVVWFSSNGYAKTRHLWRVDDLFSPNELDSLIPKTGSGSTSIGAGILAALDLLKTQHNMKGGRIYVVTDGKENTLPKIEDTLEGVKDYGAIVSFRITIEGSVSDKSSGYYKLAQATGGHVLYHPYCQLTPEDSPSRDIFFSPFTAPSDLFLNDEVTDIKEHYHVVDYFVDFTPFKGSVMLEKNLGRDTSFEFRPVPWKNSNLSWIIVSPSGKRYTDSSPCNDDEFMKIFHTHSCEIKDEHFQPGIWHYEVMSKEPHGVITLVQSRWSKQGKYAIKMTAFWQDRTLKITDDENGYNKKQIIVVEFHRGMVLMHPVLHAKVKALVTTPMRRVITLYPNDDGHGADIIPHDGIYHAYFYDFDKNGTYNVLVYGKGTNDTVVLNRSCEYGKGWYEIGPRDSTGLFTRINWGGQFRLDLTKKSEGYLYGPGKISDIRIKGFSKTNRTVQISWTAVGAQLFNGTASFYEIRIADHATTRIDRFHEHIRVTQDMILNGFNLSSPKSAGKTEIATIKLPSKINVSNTFITIMAVTTFQDRILRGEIGYTLFSWYTEENSTYSLVKSTKPVQTIVTLSNTAERFSPSHTAKPPLPSNTAAPSPGHPGNLNAGIITALVIGCTTLVVVLIGSVVWLVKKKTEHLQETVDENAVEQGNSVEIKPN